MKPHEAQTLLKNLLIDAERACEIAKVAVRNKKSVAGPNPYGNKFHEMTVSIATAEQKLRPLLTALDLDAAELEKYNASVSTLKCTDTLRGKQRADALKELRLLFQSVVLPKIETTQASPIPANENVLPMSVVTKTRGYIEKTVLQANGTYEHQWYDACSVMIRRLVETLIIEAYEAKAVAEEIKKDGHFLMLSGLIDNIQRKAAWNLQRETQAALPLLKRLGDQAAHGRRFNATKADIDHVIPGLRALTDDLLHLASLK